MIDCIRGYFIGDIVGCPLLYMIKADITDEIVDKALNMEGGGVCKMNPAQKSDESEISMCIIDCLASS